MLGKTFGDVLGSKGDERAEGRIPAPNRAAVKVVDHIVNVNQAFDLILSKTSSICRSMSFYSHR